MRLSQETLEAIRAAVRAADPAAEVYLHGSRLDDAARGGDIDLLMVSDVLNFREVLRLRRAILDRIGWQQLVLTVRRRDQLDEPFAADCLSHGVKL
jgi:predicted nucleotidyltransferase